jgi:ketosteroid isomerase-like protein
MSVNLSKPVETYFSASNMPNPEAFISVFSDDAIVIDAGQKYEGIDAIKEWSENHHFSSTLILTATDFVQGFYKTRVTAKVDGDFDKSQLPAPLLLDFDFTVDGDKIKKLITSFTPHRIESLPRVIEDYFHGSNTLESGLLSACFTEDAILYDEGKEFHGIWDIKKHLEDTNDKLHVATVIDYAVAGDGGIVVTATLSGDFDGSPCALDFRFTLNEDKISALKIILLGE